MESKQYTTDRHCEYLLKMLEHRQPCSCCPTSQDFKPDVNTFDDWTNDQCDVCREFVDINIPGAWSCPCLLLGKKEAIKRTWIALEEKGYI